MYRQRERERESTPNIVISIGHNVYHQLTLVVYNHRMATRGGVT